MVLILVCSQLFLIHFFSSIKNAFMHTTTSNPYIIVVIELVVILGKECVIAVYRISLTQTSISFFLSNHTEEKTKTGTASAEIDNSHNHNNNNQQKQHHEETSHNQYVSAGWTYFYPFNLEKNGLDVEAIWDDEDVSAEDPELEKAKM